MSSTRAAAIALASQISWRTRSNSLVESRVAFESDYLLKYDAFSTQYVFRVIMIAIFAASDLWNNGAEKGGSGGGESPSDSSQSGILSEGCLNGWVCLFNLITRVLIHTYTDPSTCSRLWFLVDLSLRHVATIRLFLLWLELQKPDSFRPKVRGAGRMGRSIWFRRRLFPLRPTSPPSLTWSIVCGAALST